MATNYFGNRKNPIPIGSSGIDSRQRAKYTAMRFNLAHSFTGLTPGVQVMLVDNLFTEETNGVYRSQVVKTGQVDNYGQIYFDGLRDSMYSLLVVDLDHTQESIHNVPIGDPQRFDTIARHTLPSQPYIYQIEVVDTGLTALANIFWRLGANGVKGYPELFYGLSGSTDWLLFDRWEDENVYSTTLSPLEFDSIYQVKVHLLNEDLLPGPWSNTVYITTPTTPMVSGEATGYTEEVCFLKFDDGTFKDDSSKNITFSGYNPLDVSDVSPIYGKASYYSSTGVTTIYSDNVEFNLNTSAPYTSFSFEGTFEVSDAISISDKLGFFGSNGHFGAWAYCQTNDNYLDKIVAQYGVSTLEVDLPPSKPGYAWEQGKAKHLLINFDASNDSVWTASIYLDGFLVGSGSAAYNISQPTAPLNLFCWDGQDAYKYKGRADNIRFVKTVGGIPSQDLTAPHIKSTVPAKGVFDTGNVFPRLRIDAHDDPETSGANPSLDFWDGSENLFFHVSNASGFVFNSGVTEGYYLKAGVGGRAYWAAVSGGTGTSVHKDLSGLTAPEDDHTQYSHIDGRRAYTAEVSGVTPIGVSGLTTKIYVDTIRNVLSGWVDNAFYEKIEFVNKGGAGSKNLPILADGDGYLDNTLFQASNITQFTSSIQHSGLGGLTHDSHTMYSRTNGSRAFTAEVSGVTPIGASGLTTKIYVDTADAIISGMAQKYLDYNADSNEPNGFENRTDSTLSYNAGTLTFTLSGNNASVWVEGTRYTLNGLYTKEWTDVEGLHYFYIDAGPTLAVTTTFDPDVLIAKKALIALLYWASDINQVIRFGEERHGIVMDSATHKWMHLTQGTQYLTGLPLADILPDEDGSLDTHAQLGIDAGTIADEDITHSISKSGVPAAIPVFYISGLLWRCTDGTSEFPVITFGGGARRLAYNYWNGVSWEQAEVDRGNYVLSHIIATNDLEKPLIAIQGQNQYSTLTLARTGATNEINSLVTAGLPTAEFTPIGTVIFQTNDVLYSNSVKARIVSTDTGSSYVDFRQFNLASVSSVNDHGNLSGLGDDDHLQYILVNGNRGFTAPVSGIYPTNSGHLSTKSYVDTVSGLVGAYVKNNYVEIADTTQIGGPGYDALVVMTNQDGYVDASLISGLTASSSNSYFPSGW